MFGHIKIKQEGITIAEATNSLIKIGLKFEMIRRDRREREKPFTREETAFAMAVLRGQSKYKFTERQLQLMQGIFQGYMPKDIKHEQPPKTPPSDGGIGNLG